MFPATKSSLAYQLIRGHTEENQGATANACMHTCSVICDSFQTMDCSPPGSPVHGIFQARILELIAISFSRGSSQPRDQTVSLSPALAGRFFNHCTSWEAIATANSQHQLPGLSMRFFWTPPSRLGCQVSPVAGVSTGRILLRISKKHPPIELYPNCRIMNKEMVTVWR